MHTIYKSLLLFVMNWLDAQLTILWIRLNVATEANALMARLLDMGEAPFLTVKLIIGAFTAYILYRCSHMTVARRGMKLALGMYLLLMLVHVITGFGALGWQAPQTVATYFGSLPHAFLALFS
jgi:cytochrome bd-type quinol oxidase subunit 1